MAEVITKHNWLNRLDVVADKAVNVVNTALENAKSLPVRVSTAVIDLPHERVRSLFEQRIRQAGWSIEYVVDNRDGSYWEIK